MGPIERNQREKRRRRGSQLDTDEEKQDVIPTAADIQPMDIRAPRPSNAEVGWEHLPHGPSGADVELHSWGENWKQAFEECAVSLFGEITEIDATQIDYSQTTKITVTGHDKDSLMFNYLDTLMHGEEVDPDGYDEDEMVK